MTNTVIILIATLLALLPAIFWFFLYRWLDRKEPEPEKAMIIAGILGIVSTLPIFGLQFFLNNYPEYNFMPKATGWPQCTMDELTPRRIHYYPKKRTD